MSTPTRWAILVYGVVCYLAFHVSFVWLVLFLNDVPIVPTINSGTSRHWAAAIAINLGLVLLFGLQHSVMARRVVQASLDEDHSRARGAPHLCASDRRLPHRRLRVLVADDNGDLAL